MATIKDKDEVAKILRDNGFNSENINGVVITTFKLGESKEQYAKYIRQVEDILLDIGYEASKGFHIVKAEDA